MSQRPQTPVVFQKASYRQRRVRDAAKLVPVFGAVLLMIPLTWQDDAQGATTNASALVYIFGVWIVLIGLTAVLSGLIRSNPQQVDKETSEE